MSEWKTCDHCGRTMPAVDMACHRCGTTPTNRAVTGADLNNRCATGWPHGDPDELHRLHKAHIERLQGEKE